ncbi:MULTISPECIES: hypothetical protein [Sphingobacterium]|uniref:hypothetical protein n=1 Tax=Sphingobacterium TaxID=28453 RepID=UPI00257AB121|nr:MULTISPECIES: hypothetical protein [Sphingobacterium]
MASLTKYVSNDRPKFAVYIEDDDRVCYAYLWKEKKIVGDIWLYNSAPTPSEPEWNNKENLPFLNPAEFVKENLKPFSASSSVEVTWDFGEEVVAKIFLASRLIAKLNDGSRPGWSSLVTKDGPLALKM